MKPNPAGRCDPFAWQDKRILRRIREQCEDPASAIGVYLALTIVASDNESETFQTTHSWLASLSGFCEKTVRLRLADLARLQAVQVTTPPIKAPCTYRLLPFDRGARCSADGCRAFGNHYRTFGNGTSSALPTSEVIEVKRGRTPVPAAPKNTADRIAAENQLKILRSRFDQLAAETAEQWQRDRNPELISEKQKLGAQIKALENSLLL